MAQSYNRDDLLIAEFKEAFNEFDKVWIFVSQAQAQTMFRSSESQLHLKSHGQELELTL